MAARTDRSLAEDLKTLSDRIVIANQLIYDLLADHPNVLVDLDRRRFGKSANTIRSTTEALTTDAADLFDATSVDDPVFDQVTSVRLGTAYRWAALLHGEAPPRFWKAINGLPLTATSRKVAQLAEAARQETQVAMTVAGVRPFMQLSLLSLTAAQSSGPRPVEAVKRYLFVALRPYSPTELHNALFDEAVERSVSLGFDRVKSEARMAEIAGIGERYARISHVGDSDKAALLVARLAELLMASGQADLNGLPSVSNEPQEESNDPDGPVPHDERAQRVRDAERTDEALDADEQDQDLEHDSDSDSDSGDGDADGADGDADGDADGEGDAAGDGDGDGDADSEGDGDGGADGSSDAGGLGSEAGDGSSAAEAASGALEVAENLSSSLMDSTTVQAQLDELKGAVADELAGGDGSSATEDESPKDRHWRPVPSEVQGQAEVVRTQLAKLHSQARPRTLRGQHSGRVDGKDWFRDRRRYRRHHEPNRALDVGMSIALLVDISGSMTHRIAEVTQMMWVLKQAVDAISTPYGVAEIKIWLFDTDAMVHAQPGDQWGHGTMLTPSRAHGGTDPLKALTAAKDWLAKSDQPNRVLVTLTDGDWSEAEASEAVVAQINKGGAHSALFGLDQAVDRFGLHEHHLGADLEGPLDLVDPVAQLVTKVMSESLAGVAR